MSGILRLRCKFYSLYDREYDIEVYDTDYTGAVVTFDCTQQGFGLRFSGGATNRIQSIISSECTVNMRIDSVGTQAFVDEFVEAQEGRFFLRIVRYIGLSAEIDWSGMLLHDRCNYPDQDRFFFELRATDGLATMKDLVYDNAGVPYTGYVKIKDVILNCLNKLPYVPGLFSMGEKFMTTAIDWWEANHVAGDDKDPLALTYCDQAAFYKIVKGVSKPMNCYEVLENVLDTFGARLLQADGEFRVEQISYKATTAGHIERVYSRNGVYIEFDEILGKNRVEQASFGALVATGNYEFLPALKKVTVDFNTGSRRNYIDNIVLNESLTLKTYSGTKIESNGGQCTLRFSGSLLIKVKNTTYTGVPYPAIIVYAIRIVVGTKVYTRNYSYQNNQVTYGAASWVDDAPGLYYPEVLLIGSFPPINNTGTFYLNISFNTNEIPSDATGYSVGLNLLEIILLIGGTVPSAHYEASWNVGNPWLEVYSYGVPELNELGYKYVQTNPTTGNSAEVNTEVLLGDSSNPNGVGALRWLNGSEYVRTELWGEGVGARTLKIGQLLAKIILLGQRKPVKTLQGRIRGRLNLALKYEWQGMTWIMISGNYNAGTDTIDGVWFLADYDGTLTPRPVIVNNDTPTYANPSDNNLGGIGQTSGFVTMPPATVLQSVADNTLPDILLAGVITTIPLSEAVGEGEYITGDEITIVNPFTSQTETLLVTTDSAAAATTLAVSGTLTGVYPPGSYIIKKKKTGYQLNDVKRSVVTNVGGSVVVTAAAAVQPRKADHIKLIVGRLVYTSTEGDFTVTKTPTTFTLNTVNVDCLGLDGFVEWFY